jgi:cytochrome c biogenesis protein CcdA
MGSLLSSLAVIALVDSVNPNAMAVQVYLLSTPRPVARSAAFILGDFAAAWIAGFVLAFGLTQVVTQLFNRLGDVIYLLQFLLGIVLVIVGLNIHKFTSQHTSVRRPKSLKPSYTFLLGLSMAIVETPTALPFLAGMERISRANLDLPQLLGAVTFYNVIFVFPLIVLLGIYIIFQHQADRFLSGINQFVNRWFPHVIRLILIVLGLVLIADCVAQIFNFSLV